MMAGKEGNNSELPIMIVDCDIKRIGYIRQVNTTYAKMFGTTTTNLVGQHLKLI